MHQGLLHAAHPLYRHAALAILIVHRHNFVFEHGIDGAGVDLVLILGIGFPVADGPASGDLIAFIEPAIQNAEIQHAVDAGFHAAGAARFFAAPGSVQPQVHALHHLTRNLDAVILHENNVLGDLGRAGKLHDFANQRLARQVAGVRLSGDHNLYRPFRIGEQPL